MPNLMQLRQGIVQEMEAFLWRWEWIEMGTAKHQPMCGSLRKPIEEALGAPLTGLRSLAGGDICQAFVAECQGRAPVFVKVRPQAPAGFFAAEARGLAWLGQPAGLRVPAMVAVGAEFLMLEYLPGAARRPDFDEVLGRGLAELHRPSKLPYGWEGDNFIGTLPQSNEPALDWVQFYTQRRLQVQLERACSLQLAPPAWRARFERLYQALPGWLPNEPPARLHGDLWGGNCIVGPAGEPCLVDPAVYVGQREVDLAMMRLFGGFGAAVFAAYEEAYPLAGGHSERLPLYQLYPLLVHLNLFGPGYVGALEQALGRLPG
jgi:fructosamine-3-kinase